MRDMGPILAEKEKLVNFAREVINVAFEGGSLDGCDIQEWGIKHGLLVEEKYDPDIHGEDLGFDFAPGDSIFVFDSILKLRNAPESNESARADKGGI